MQKLHGINPAMAATPWSWKPPLHAAMHFHQRYAAASPPAAAASPPAAGDAVIPPAPAPASDPPKCKPLCSRHAQKTAADFKAMAAAAAASQEQNVAKAAAALSPYTSRSRAELRAYMRGPGAGVLKEHSLVFLHEQQPGSKQEYNAARDVLWSEVSSPAKRDLLEAIIAEGTFGLSGGRDDPRLVAAQQVMEAAEEAAKEDPANLELKQASLSAAKGREKAIAAAKRTSLGKASAGRKAGGNTSGMSGRISSPTETTAHKCKNKKCAATFRVRATTDQPKHQSGKGHPSCGGRCEGGKGCTGCA